MGPSNGSDMPPRKTRLSGEERRRTFLDAAASLIGRTGVDSVTMEGVAAELGVNKSLPYRYFTNRDDLLLQLFDRETDAFDARVGAAVAAAETFDERLRAVIDSYLDEVLSSSLLVTQFEVSRPDDDPYELRRRERAVGIVSFVADLLRDEYPLTRRDAVIVASILASASQGVVGLAQHGGFSRRRIVDTYVQMCRGAASSVAHPPSRT